MHNINITWGILGVAEALHFTHFAALEVSFPVALATQAGLESGPRVLCGHAKLGVANPAVTTDRGCTMALALW